MILVPPNPKLPPAALPAPKMDWLDPLHWNLPVSCALPSKICAAPIGKGEKFNFGHGYAVGETIVVPASLPVEMEKFQF